MISSDLIFCITLSTYENQAGHRSKKVHLVMWPKKGVCTIETELLLEIIKYRTANTRDHRQSRRRADMYVSPMVATFLSYRAEQPGGLSSWWRSPTFAMA